MIILSLFITLLSLPTSSLAASHNRSFGKVIEPVLEDGLWKSTARITYYEDPLLPVPVRQYLQKKLRVDLYQHCIWYVKFQEHCRIASFEMSDLGEQAPYGDTHGPKFHAWEAEYSVYFSDEVKKTNRSLMTVYPGYSEYWQRLDTSKARSTWESERSIANRLLQAARRGAYERCSGDTLNPEQDCLYQDKSFNYYPVERKVDQSNKNIHLVKWEASLQISRLPNREVNREKIIRPVDAE